MYANWRRTTAAALACLTLGCEAAAVKTADDAGSLDLGTTPIKTAHRIYVFDTVGFTRLDKDGRAPGFDLDHKVSDETDVDTCSQADFIGIDGTPGIDNQFATLVPLIEATGISAVSSGSNAASLAPAKR